MKTKKEILKMTKRELESYKWRGDLSRKGGNKNCSECSNCSNCSNCFDCFNCSRCSYCSACSDCYNCSGCSHCSHCSFCRRAIGLKYAICNVELTVEEYEKKMKELKG